ncbi:helix-turn-helix domain-containing protein, partial [Salmonella enterica subsp. enterica]
MANSDVLSPAATAANEVPDGKPERAARESDPNFVTALARGLELLRCFRTGESMLGNQDFVRRTGLPKATVSRL